MALTSDQITAQNFADFYQMILPYLNGQNIQKTLSGTTMAGLISAIGALTEWQKNNCIIKITYAGNDLYMRRKINNRYATGYVGASNNNGTVREYYLETAQSKFSYIITTGTTSTDQDSLSFTSWELYYQG